MPQKISIRIPSGENCSFEDYSEEQWDNVIDTDIKGSFMCCQIFGNEMAKDKNGSIINISSIYGIVSPDHHYEYKRKNGDFKTAYFSQEC